MEKLAIDGGKKVFETPANIPSWPPVYEDTAEEIKALYLSHAWSFYGKKEVEFNNEFAKYTGAKHCAMMANGTVTLEVAMQALGIGPGDEVIVPAYTWIATGEAVVVCGATPVIVDIDPETFCIDTDRIEEAITSRTKAIIPVHLYGSMSDMDRVMEIAKKHNLFVIEDCAHAHGGEWNGRHVGTIGDVGSFSFQQSKTMVSGEGGACLCNDDELGDKLGRISHIGYQYAAKQGQAGTPPPMGLICHNYRVTEFQALILLSQLRYLRRDTELRAANAEYLRGRLNAIDGISCQKPGRCATLQGYYNFGVRLDSDRLKDGITRAEFVKAVCAEDAPVGIGWGNPMYRQKLWSVPENMYRISSCDVAERLATKDLIVIPLQWLMTPREDLSKLADAFEKVMAAYAK
ncbi:MAG: DegT/DnrJ/EryC1/StrS family aminotransferase [Victivallaceae bacterium]|nr:DegT/DnrJ/EryC1/StrS family aminotransferase [Victivallaceae bacterium]